MAIKQLFFDIFNHVNQGVILITLWVGVLLTSCGISERESIRWEIPPTWVDGVIQAMVETPLGEHYTYQFDTREGDLDTLKDGDGIPVLDLVPGVVNSGFVPYRKHDTLMRIPVRIAGLRIKPGSQVGITPIGVISYTQSGVTREEIFALPFQRSLSNMQSLTFGEFIIEGNAIKFMFEYWLRNRHGLGSVSQISWKDERAAQEILDQLVVDP